MAGNGQDKLQTVEIRCSLVGEDNPSGSMEINIAAWVLGVEGCLLATGHLWFLNRRIAPDVAKQIAAQLQQRFSGVILTR